MKKSSKYKNIFVKGYIQNWSEEVIIVIKVGNTFPWTYVISDLNGESIFRTEKVIKRKGDKLYVKW